MTSQARGTCKKENVKHFELLKSLFRNLVRNLNRALGNQLESFIFS